VVAYIALSVVAFGRWGLLTRRDWIWIWLLLGLLLISLSDLRGWVQRVLRDWVPFMAMILAYDLLRGVSDGLVAAAHTQPQIDFDRLVFAGHLPTVTLQNHLFHRHTHLHWYDYATWGVYTTHFVVTVLVAAALWRIRPERFRRFRNRVVTLVFAGIATFAVYPTVPPWLAAKHHHVPTVRRITLHVSHHVGIHQVGAIYEQGSHFANVVAAVPSLHAAFPMLLLLFFWSSGWAVRVPLALYVLAMGIAVVYSGEHYVFDVLAGWVYAAAAIVAANAAGRAWRRRREARPRALTHPSHSPLPSAKAPPPSSSWGTKSRL
jgi:hypothetical protein